MQITSDYSRPDVVTAVISAAILKLYPPYGRHIVNSVQNWIPRPQQPIMYKPQLTITLYLEQML